MTSTTMVSESLEGCFLNVSGACKMHRELIETVVKAMPERYSYNVPDAVRELYNIGNQESDFKHRRQQPQGPARGWFQFEPIACHEVVKRDPSVLSLFKLPTNPDTLYKVLEWSEVGMIVCARVFLYYRSPYRLPKKGEVELGWRQYVQAWAPGKPHKGRWFDNWED